MARSLIHKLVCSLLLASATLSLSESRAETAIPRHGKDSQILKDVLLPPGPDNPRNSEGDFIQLTDGRVLFVYTHFSGGRGDHANAHLAARVSDDGGISWSTEDTVVLPNEGEMNVMSVSLLRLDTDEIALFYLRKDSITDCRPFMRLSHDECQTWSEAIEVIPDQQAGYYVLNNDRVVELKSGRLVAPVALHTRDGEWDSHGEVMCYLSDDRGRSWRRSKSQLRGATRGGTPITLQEPGVIELAGGRLMMFIRSTTGSQQVSYSSDGGETWSEPRASNIISPRSSATIKRIPETGDLLLVWNNHKNIAPDLQNKRTPLHAAISTDEGKTWEVRLVLEDDPDGWYCYTAMEFVKQRVLLSYCAGDHSKRDGLTVTQMTSFPVELLYQAE